MGNLIRSTERSTPLPPLVSPAPSFDYSVVTSSSGECNDEILHSSPSWKSQKSSSNLRFNPYFMGGLEWNDSEESMRLREMVGQFRGISRANFIRERHNEPIINHYQLDPVVMGRGSSAIVQRAICLSTGNLRAVKTIPKHGRRFIKSLRTGIDILKEMDHPNIVKLFETFETPHEVYLVMELCQGGELFDRITSFGRLSEPSACFVMRQVLSAIAYLQSVGISHRDIKAENFLFTDQSGSSSLKLVDFGYAVWYKLSQIFSTKVGTPYYVSPEILSGRYGFNSDDWSCGVILYIMLSGRPPFNGNSDVEIFEKIKRAELQFPRAQWKGISMEARNLISSLLQKNPKDRCTSFKALDHEWFQTYAESLPMLPLPKTLVRNLRAFSSVSPFKRAALTVMAHFLKEEDVKNLQKIFFALDPSHRGILSLQEVVAGLHQLGLRDLPSDFLQVLEVVDSNRSGFIDYTEFIAAAAERRTFLKRKDVVRSAFIIFDLNSDGKISSSDICSLLGIEAEGIETEVNARELIQEFDLDGNGEIDYDEFYLMVKQTSDVAFEKKTPAVDWTRPLPGPRSLSELVINFNSYKDGIVDFKPNVELDTFQAVPLAY